MGKLEAKNITLRSSEKIVLDDVSVEIPCGKLTLVMGPPDSGKQFFIKTMAGILIPSKGQILYNGINIYDGNIATQKKHDFRCSFVFQNGGLLANLTIYENLRLALDNFFHKMKDDEKVELIQNYLSRYNLPGIINKRPSELSVDNLKTVGFIRALMIDPVLLIMNEPFSDCELNTVDMLLEEIGKLKYRKLTMLVVNQTTANFEKIADWVIFMEHGKIVNKSKSDQQGMME